MILSVTVKRAVTLTSVPCVLQRDTYSYSQGYTAPPVPSPELQRKWRQLRALRGRAVRRGIDLRV